jgi:hypothetical protein
MLSGLYLIRDLEARQRVIPILFFFEYLYPLSSEALPGMILERKYPRRSMEALAATA